MAALYPISIRMCVSDFLYIVLHHTAPSLECRLSIHRGFDQPEGVAFIPCNCGNYMDDTCRSRVLVTDVGTGRVHVMKFLIAYVRIYIVFVCLLHTPERSIYIYIIVYTHIHTCTLLGCARAPFHCIEAVPISPVASCLIFADNCAGAIPMPQMNNNNNE